MERRDGGPMRKTIQDNAVVVPPWFDGFMEPAADRSAVLSRVLEAAGVACRIMDLSGGRFVVAWPGGGTRDSRYRVKVVTAHHDRVPGTPGALDNSAACLQLVNFLASVKNAFNMLVVFTDREELGSLSAVSRVPAAGSPGEQGSFELGKAFAGMGLHAPMVFPLDVTGRGDSLVLSLASRGLASRGERPGGLALETLVAETDDMAAVVARMMAGRARVFRALVPFGEDLGFILAGVPALAVTVLPRDEAGALADSGGLPAWASPIAPGCRTPETWSHLHGPGDTTAQYTRDAFELVSRFLDRLSALRVPSPVD